VRVVRCRVLYVVWRMRRASTYVHEAEIEADGMPRTTSLCGPREGWDEMALIQDLVAG
jgi:hypothetical protein